VDQKQYQEIINSLEKCEKRSTSSVTCTSLAVLILLGYSIYNVVDFWNGYVECGCCCYFWGFAVGLVLTAIAVLLLIAGCIDHMSMTTELHVSLYLMRDYKKKENKEIS
jgi:hypothetical protein